MMHGEASRLVALWRAAADDLGLSIESPFDLRLPSGPMERWPLVVRDFGARNGMIVLLDYSRIRDRRQEVHDAGFGYSVMEEAGPGDPYVREEFVDLLSDWGWSGAFSSTPAWITSP
jgi:hypothetical protein